MIINGMRVSRQAFVGDPFLGAVAGGLLRTGAAALARRLAPKAITTTGAIAIRAPAGAITAPGVRILPGAGALAVRGARIARTVVPGVESVIQVGRALAGPGGRRLPSGFADTGRPRRRRMNPLNPRALRRALSRAGAFEKFCRRTLVITKRVRLKKRGTKR